MKTAKSIIVVLFVLLTAQMASAYYCPSTGRWLSRDPIGEPGFQLLQMASSPLGIRNSVLQSSGRWVNRDPLGEKGDPNLYGFCKNDGINLNDIFGLATITTMPSGVVVIEVSKCEIVWDIGHGFTGPNSPVFLGPKVGLGPLDLWVAMQLKLMTV